MPTGTTPGNVADTWKKCGNPVTIVRDVETPWNPDSETITVNTDSVAGSEKFVDLEFHDKFGAYKGGMFILFSTPIKYYIVYCMDGGIGYIPFPVTLPSETQKTWTITYNYTEKRLVLHCNGVQVLNVLLTSACTRIDVNWRDWWENKPTQIEFPSTDTASDNYCFSSNTGNYNGCY